MSMYRIFPAYVKLKDVQILRHGETWELLGFLLDLSANEYSWSSMSLLQESSPTRV